MKWIGALLLIGTTTWIGFDISNKLTARTKQIRLLIQSLQMLEAEMGYSQLSLQQIFNNISEKMSEPLRLFYKRLAQRLSTVVTDFISVWDKELSHLKQYSAMKQNEMDIMKQFGRHLGHHNFIQQQKQIKLTIHYLQAELDEAIEQSRKYEKMSQTLGLLVGLFIVLLLF